MKLVSKRTSSIISSKESKLTAMSDWCEPKFPMVVILEDVISS